MPHHAELPEEPFASAPTPANDPSVPLSAAEIPLDFDDDLDAPRAPLRFGRLALWMASASALGIGVLGTVAYSMWFNHDQRVYTEAMASARHTLGIDQPVIAAGPPSQTLSSGVVQAPPPTASLVAARADNTALADNLPPDTSDTTSLGPVAAAPVAAVTQGATQQAATASNSASNPEPQTVAASRASRAASAARVRTAQAKEAARHRASRAKPEPGLFARVGAFFHRVSYRRNATSGQREEYSRP
ncbi:hypothetical protein P9239_11105 [Caballeronia sp. LZ062]|uniref:hypothetical protein n=1 Tax=unclassified Caballeronia TaxID=2646786 RepID=UPI0028639FB3|nr:MULTISPECIES: hypothetical protein [unclassified Caballeronia]MDR5854577.1 hypothetical protein [Caballeronia sp. LZ050]MDR5870894.1 hypothetical protein [Caballeronia sp. LZ062]